MLRTLLRQRARRSQDLKPRRDALSRHSAIYGPCRDKFRARYRQFTINAFDTPASNSWLGLSSTGNETEVDGEEATKPVAPTLPSAWANGQGPADDAAATYLERNVVPLRSGLLPASLQAQHPPASELGDVISAMKDEDAFISPWLTSNGQDAPYHDEADQDIEEMRRAVVKVLSEPEETDHNELLAKLWNLLGHEGLTKSLPSTSFVEVLRRIEPPVDFLPTAPLYAQRIPKWQKLLRGRVDLRMQQLITRRTIVMNICRIRLNSRRELQRKEYTELLRCARNTYDGKAAARVMWMMINQKMELDASCYKSLLEAKCWSDAWSPFERCNLRLFPRVQAIGQPQRGEIEISEDFASRPYQLGSKGLGKQVPTLISKMVRSGISVDRDVIGYLITALARQGDMAGVKVALRGSWDVDVDALGTIYRYGPKLPDDSPLHPNEHSLFVIAHAFCSNHDVATALRVVDFMAGKYSITIPLAVWEELMEWSFVLSKRRNKRDMPEGKPLRQLPSRTPDDLWNLFTSKGSSSVPSLPMLDLNIRNQARYDAFPTFLHYACEAMRQLYQEQQASSAKIAAQQTAVIDVAKAQAVKEHASQLFLHFTYIQHWASLLLRGARWQYKMDDQAWQTMCRVFFPDIVEIFWRYRPAEGISYTIDTGHIHLKAWKQSQCHIANTFGVSSTAMDDDNNYQDPEMLSFTAQYPVQSFG